MRRFVFATAGTLVVAVPGRPARQEPVPFVGCPADGQQGPIEAPRGAAPLKGTAGDRATAVAFYKGANAPGAFAPRGWHCRAWYGSSGSGVLISPARIEPESLGVLPRGVSGPAVELTVSYGGTSGRFAVATYLNRLFPGTDSAFVHRVESEGLVPVGDLHPEPYADDVTRRLDSRVVGFTTPPMKRGLGTERSLRPSRWPVRGVAVLTTDSVEPDMLILRVRVSSPALARSLVDLNRPCMQRESGC